MFVIAFATAAFATLLVFLTPLNQCQVEAGSASPWFLQPTNSRQVNGELEREALLSDFGPQLMSKRILNQQGLMTLINQQEVDLFQCVEPTRSLFDNFVQQYNRTFESNSDKLERLNLFVTSIKRTIMFNRIIQNEIFNQSNYDKKVQIANYHFISPLNERNLPLWYVDITDCELGLIKKIIFDLIYLIDKNELAAAYRVALDNSQHLPLLNDFGFQQLADILLVRLYDRFKGDQKMDQLFRWPIYLRRLAAYAYNRREAATPDFKERLALISFAYPAYFKDLKYNLPAVNRTGDNLKVHSEHEKFNKLLNRKFVNLAERNKRLAVFRQHWTYVNLLNEDKSWQKQNVSLPPDWIQLQYHLSTDQRTYLSSSSERLTDSEATLLQQQQQQLQQQQLQQQQQQVLPTEGRFKHTQFSDLTDAEFVAYLTNDFSLLDNNQESANYIDRNFPIRQLDARFRNEIAAELEQRSRLANRIAVGNEKRASERSSSTALARKVIEELISDVGLPVGSVILEDFDEQEVYNAFNRVASFFSKPYALDASPKSSSAPTPSLSDIKDERVRRYERFKVNYGKFKAWFVKEGWQLSEELLTPMLRLADLSWNEIKLSLFKICCLTEESLATLATQNASLYYLSSNQFMCQQLTDDENTTGESQGSEQSKRARELIALELYYYYSVHFNKHHSDEETFNRRLFIFKQNIDRLRHHSCTRGLTLYRSLKLKHSDTLNTIDSLDTRRSYTDDLNLDRFRYFQVINLYAEPQPQQQTTATDSNNNPDIGFERLQAVEPSADNYNQRRRQSYSANSRAGISYRREAFFNDLLEARGQQRHSPGVSYADKLSSSEHDVDLYSNKYRENSAAKVYELVMQRYRYCVKMLRHVDLEDNLAQQCQSSGPLADQASATGLSDSNSYNGNSNSNQQYSLQLQNEDQCAFYRNGLEPWAEGLIKQDLLSANLIQSARCQFIAAR